MIDDAADVAAVNATVQAFFAAFTTGPDVAAALEGLEALFLPRAVIVKTCGDEPVVYDVPGFIAPRRELLTGGQLANFREWPVSGRVDVFGDVAHWFGAYAKSGVQDGVPFTGGGMKSIQFVRTAGGWRISAAAWDDHPSAG